MATGSGKTGANKRIPSAADYTRALRSLVPLPPSYVAMMQFHYHAPTRTTTAAAVAKAVGFKSFRAAGLHYGRLAGLVGNQFGWNPHEEGEVKLAVLAKFSKTRGHWHWIMREELAQALENLGMVGPAFDLMPGEMPEKINFSEGAIYHVAVTAYERNPEARRACLSHYGTSCVVCGFDFKATYGPMAEGFIHVHHVRMLSAIGKEYSVNPVDDLRPVCPNCHAVIHLKTPPWSVDELKTVVITRRETR